MRASILQSTDRRTSPMSTPCVRLTCAGQKPALHAATRRLVCRWLQPVSVGDASAVFEIHFHRGRIRMRTNSDTHQGQVQSCALRKLHFAFFSSCLSDGSRSQGLKSQGPRCSRRRAVTIGLFTDREGGGVPSRAYRPNSVPIRES